MKIDLTEEDIRGLLAFEDVCNAEGIGGEAGSVALDKLCAAWGGALAEERAEYHRLEAEARQRWEQRAKEYWCRGEEGQRRQIETNRRAAGLP